MSSTKFTPGKWILETHHRYGAEGPIPVWYIKATNDVGIAVQPSFSCPDHETANAHLIAAAPELYEALEGVLQYVIAWRYEYASKPQDKHNNAQRDLIDKSIRSVEAALKKARGE